MRSIYRKTRQRNLIVPSQERYTPPDLFPRIQAMLGGEIDLDPASNPQRTVPAKRHYTEADNGLLLPWGIRQLGPVGQPDVWRPEFRVFANWPWGQLMKWVAVAAHRYAQGQFSDLVALVPERTETAWYHELSSRFPVCHPTYRIGYLIENEVGDLVRIKGSLPYASHFFYLGRNIDRFADAAQADEFGRVFVPYRTNWRIA